MGKSIGLVISNVVFKYSELISYNRGSYIDINLSFCNITSRKNMFGH